jgi:hypothetical protein
MKQHFNRIMLVQGIVLTTLGAFATDGHHNGPGNIPAKSHYLQSNCYFLPETNVRGQATDRFTINLPGEKITDTIIALNSTVIKTVLTEHMVSFSAAYMSHAIDLRWVTAKGKSYDHFYIERSLDGTNFENVGEVKGDATSPGSPEYSFADYVKPSVTRKNDLYYRLKQIDGENQASFSKLLIVRMYNSKTVTAVSVTPDPAVNDILVNVQLKENSLVVMTVKDDNGSQVMKKVARAENGANSFSLDGTSKLLPGTYKLEVIINSNERMTMQLIKS